MNYLPRPQLFIILSVSLALLLNGCGRLARNTGPLVYDVSVTPDTISPNADGDDDVTEIRYSLRSAAAVSIYFEDESGERFYFRDSEPRAPGSYSVNWGGTTNNPMTMPAGELTADVISHVLPDGVYRWSVEATPQRGEPVAVSGEITLRDGDTDIPQLSGFAIVPTVFTPNQDSIDDRVSISYSLSEDVATMQVYLEDPAQPGVRFYIPPKPGVADPTESGYHDHDYDGGVDLNAEPPADGTYTVVAEASDAAGNAVRVTGELTIQEGGKPRADVKGGEIDWENEMSRVITIAMGEQICFTAYVVNEGLVPIRTNGPWPGQEYLFTENSNTLAQRREAETGESDWGPQAGAWYFGIMYDTAGTDFPFRWAVGRQEDLEMRMIDGQEQWYLMPGETGEVSGCITVNEKPPVGTTAWYGGLIHQSVEVANNNIDGITVNVGVP